MVELHDVQCDPGKTIDSFFGNLYITTFKKLPIINPASAAIPPRNNPGSITRRLHQSGKSADTWQAE